MFELLTQYIAAPLIGGVIGYITNDLAIRMLFWPHTAKYQFVMKIPFTSGIILKEKGLIAKAIGGAISENLMNPKVLQRNLLSDYMILKVKTSFEEFLDMQRNNQESVGEFLKHYLSEDELESIVSSVNANLTSQVHTSG